MEVFESLRDTVVGKNVRIVLPEGQEPRILQAVKRIIKESEVTPVLLGNQIDPYLLGDRKHYGRI